MKKTLLLLIAPFFLYSQSETEIINPKGKWYFGAEIGWNEVTSFNYDEGKNSVSAGLIAEYYFAKQWSVQGKVKYMKTGLSYLKTGGGWDFNWLKASQLQEAQYPYYNRFDGHAIVIPIDIKWEFRFFQNLHGSLKLGPALNLETKSTYNYNNDSEGTSSAFLSINVGYGINYYLSEKYSLGIDFETYSMGDSKGSTQSNQSWSGKTYATNALYSFQIKYHF